MQRLFDQVSRGWRGAPVLAGRDDLGELESRHLPAPAAARGPIFAPAEVVELDLVGHLHRPSRSGGHIHKLTWISTNSVIIQYAEC